MNPLEIRSWVAIAVFAAAMCSWPLAELWAQQDHCDPALEVDSYIRPAYENRGNRCEGIYIEKKSGSLSVASFTLSFPDYQLAGQSLLVEWTAPPSAAVRLRARSFRPRLYYRMDRMQPPHEASFEWPLDILASSNLNLKRGELGLVGWYSADQDDKERSIYLPLRISQPGRQAAPPRYELKIYTARELDEVYLSLAPVGSDWAVGDYLVDEVPLDYGYYPAERPVEVPLGELEEGIYFVEIAAELKGGGTAALPFWIHVPGP